MHCAIVGIKTASNIARWLTRAPLFDHTIWNPECEYRVGRPLL
ncbi:MAG: hypothetical protein ACXVFI_08370 [Solirubrobacteraceae bacterium]